MEWEIVVGFVVLIFIIILISVVAFLVFGNPIKELLQRIWGDHQDLRKQLPVMFADVVSKEVSSGVEPVRKSMNTFNTELSQSSEQLRLVVSQVTVLREQLETSHGNFQGAVMTLADTGSLQEWISTLESTIKPLQEVHNSISGNYETSKNLLETSGNLLEDWAKEGRHVASNVSDMVKLIEKWIALEEVNRRNIEDRIMVRLTEVNEENSRLKRAVETFGNHVRKLSDETGNLQETTESANTTLKQLVQSQEREQQSQGQIVADMQQIVTNLRQMETILNKSVENVSMIVQKNQEQLEAMQTDFQQRLEAIRTNFQQTTTTFHERHESILNELGRSYETLVETQKDILQKAHKAASNLPTNLNQKIQIGMLGMLIVTNIVVGVTIILMR